MPREQIEIHLRYEGPDVDDGTMSIQDIVPVLQGFASAYGKIASSDDPSSTHRLRITGIRRGSADILLEVWTAVKGGVKLDHQGGAKPDHYENWEGFVLLDLQGWLERRSAPPLGGAFRPERKAPLQIVAACRPGKGGTTFGGQAFGVASACFP